MVPYIRLILGLAFLSLFSEITSNNTLDCVCGTENSRGLTFKIVGGKVTKPNQYPWIVPILGNMNFIGGGSIINDLYILTAAHVVRGFVEEEIDIAVGVHNRITMDDETSKVYEVEELIIHPDFKQSILESDIALIKLIERIKYNGIISPICLPKGIDLLLNAVNVLGWGVRKYLGSPSRTLRSARLNIMSPEECIKSPIFEILNGKSVNKYNFICGIYPGRDSCQGDSGGPLMSKTETKFYIMGVVSNGYRCAEPGYPGLYTNVSLYYKWIIENTPDGNYCKN